MKSPDRPIDSPVRPFGFVLADKPIGLGSAALVSQLRREMSGARVGHTGTLDRFASGLMLLVVGRATVFADNLLHRDKSYRAVFQFGRSTDTHDPVGNTIDSREADITGRYFQDHLDEIRDRILEFGEQRIQIPPLFSALKKEGRRYSDRARGGERELPSPREIRVHDLAIERIDTGNFRIGITIRVSSGTYIRAFARDLGEKLDFPVHLAELRRLSIGNFTIDDTRLWQPDGGAPVLIGVGEAFPDWPVVSCDDRVAADIRQGRRVSLPVEIPPENDFFMRGPGGQLLAWARSGVNPDDYNYKKVFSD